MRCGFWPARRMDDKRAKVSCKRERQSHILDRQKGAILLNQIDVDNISTSKGLLLVSSFIFGRIKKDTINL